MPGLMLRATGEGSGVVELGRGTVVIGRHPECTVSIDDEKASRKHCAIGTDRSGRIVIKDLDSRNGTKVNGKKVRAAVLSPGDVVAVGACEFVVEVLPEETVRMDFGELEIDNAIDKMMERTIEDDVIRTGEHAEWLTTLVRVLRTLPPKTTAEEKITLVDARGKDTAALVGAGDGARAARLLIQIAAKARATDVHIEPKGDEVLVRLRVDGQMVAIAHLPNRVGETLLGLIKTACHMRVSGREALHDGHFSVRFSDRKVEYRVSVTPSVHGQKTVLRVLDEVGVPHSLTELGLAPYMYDRIKRVCHQDSGLLLVCGPTGSGKTTTLYNALREIDRDAKNVVTIEDPVEYQIDGVTQMPIDHDRGNTFGHLLRSVLRQDPDVILVGEIRDEETASTAMRAAMTGHVVFTTVHAKDTIAAVFRLLDLKVEPYLVANSLDLVLAQRLVRRLCEECKREVPVKPGEATRLGKYLSNKTSMYTSTGCAKCLQTGFRGRLALFELLDFTDELRDVVLNEPTIAGMKKVIATGLFTTLAQSGWRLVAEGLTSLEEVDQVAGHG